MGLFEIELRMNNLKALVYCAKIDLIKATLDDDHANLNEFDKCLQAYKELSNQYIDAIRAYLEAEEKLS
jgi:hypothetical protein